VVEISLQRSGTVTGVVPVFGVFRLAGSGFSETVSFFGDFFFFFYG
jgi:hypothetical protein